jgi:DNA-binding SARP family transcriptional activator
MLLALLAVRHGRTVTVDHAVDALWPGVPPHRPEANVATLVSRLRARFGPDLITGGRLGYRLNELTMVDLHEAAELVTEAEAWLSGGHPVTGLLAAEQGIALVGGGPVLPDYPTSEWAEEARAMQAGLLRRAWHAGAEGALGSGAATRARLLAEAAIQADPLDEAGYRLLMRACVAAGEPAKALLAYERLRAILVVELGTSPVQETRDLHVSILRGAAVSV